MVCAMVCASLSQTNARPYALSMLFALMLICAAILCGWHPGHLVIRFAHQNDCDYDCMS